MNEKINLMEKEIERLQNLKYDLIEYILEVIGHNDKECVNRILKYHNEAVFEDWE
jgi:hypothetical protein